MSITPTRDQFKALLKLPKDQPVNMVNLLKFKKVADGGQESGAEAYARYMQNVAPMIQREGGRLAWMGDAKSLFIGSVGADDWDRVVIVEYPNPRAFIRMNSTEEYAAIHHDREAGLERTVLLVSEALPVPER